MHFGYFGLTLISFYIYLSHLRGAFGHFGVLHVVLMKIVGDFKGPKGCVDQSAIARCVRGGRREGAGRVTLVYLWLTLGSVGAVWEHFGVALRM